MQKESVEIAQELLALKPDIALITAVPLLKAHQKSKLLIKGLTHPIVSPIQSSDLKRQLHNIITSHFSKVYSLISHQKIYSFIQGLDPLSSSTKEITRLCDDPESSIKELINVVSSDSITTAGILHSISLPIYGLKATSSVDRAVASFGKRTIKALTLSGLACKLGSLSLGAYNINEEQFKQTSSLRLALMNSWYSHINSADLSILSSSAILGNLGEILINQELVKEGLDEEFKSFKDEEFSQAEVTLLKTSTAFVTADILEFWGLEADLIDSIRYSDSPFNASTLKIQKLACANAVIYQMVTPHGELLEEIPKRVRELMQKARLDEKVLESALKTLSS
jgi:HD-like signal output (HDOD) protein